MQRNSEAGSPQRCCLLVVAGLQGPRRTDPLRADSRALAIFAGSGSPVGRARGDEEGYA
jgi:hypothetical protein